ncbi:MAG: MFS transporter [Gemmatimonadaceae bacterium]|nr:MFS transporter [Gemmatimonadaceae bacterium]
MTAERTPWLVITLLCLVSFVAYLVRTDVTIAQESMAPALGLTMRDMGVLSAWGFQLAYALGQVPAGVLVDRFGGRVMLLVAIGGWAVASLASAAVSGTVTIAFTALLGTRVLLGLSQAITFPAIALVVAQEVPAARRVSASAFYFAASSLGSAVAPPLFAPVMVRYGWRAVFAVSAFIGVGAALVWLLRAPRRAAETTRVTLGARWRAIVALFAIPALRWLSWSYLLHSAVYFVFVFWFVRYLIDARGFGMLATGLWASVPHLMAMVSIRLRPVMT